MSGYDNEGDGAAAWNEGGDGGKVEFTFQDARSGGDNGFDHANGGLAETSEKYGAGGDNACRNCGQEGHFARDCTEERKVAGDCYNCGQRGHIKSDCPGPRKFKGECRACGKEGHPAADCPDRTIACKRCLQEGHEAIDCQNFMIIDLSHVADKTVPEAWQMLQQASNERDIGDFKEAVAVLSKAMPELTYPALERECRERKFNVYLIAMEKDHGDTYTNVTMQGEVDKKFAVFYFTSNKVQRPTMEERWPKNAEENFERLADAGIPVDRGVSKCHNCNEVGHTSKRCEQERATIDRPTISCVVCGEEGHRARDCKQERRSNKPRACKVCEAEDHLAKDCPNREKRTCRNCGSEDHVAKECDQPRNPATIQCRNCDQMGHASRDCTAPKDWSRVKCSNCEEFGHGAKRCKQPLKEVGEDEGFGGGFADTNAAGFDTGNAGGETNGIWKSAHEANNTRSGHNDWEVAAAAPVAVTASGSGGDW